MVGADDLVVSVRVVPQELAQALDACANATGRTRSAVVRDALADYVERGGRSALSAVIDSCTRERRGCETPEEIARWSSILDLLYEASRRIREEVA